MLRVDTPRLHWLNSASISTKDIITSTSVGEYWQSIPGKIQNGLPALPPWVDIGFITALKAWDRSWCDYPPLKLALLIVPVRPGRATTVLKQASFETRVAYKQIRSKNINSKKSSLVSRMGFLLDYACTRLFPRSVEQEAEMNDILAISTLRWKLT